MQGTEPSFLALYEVQAPTGSPPGAAVPALGERCRLFAAAWQACSDYLEVVSATELVEAIPVRIGKGPYSLPRWQLLAQSLLHAAHHRGELSIVLTELGAPLPTLDPILFFIRESGQEWLG